MKTTNYIAIFLLTSAFVSCSDSADVLPSGNVLCFSASHEWRNENALSRSSFPMGFAKGDEIEVFACYDEQANTSSFSPNFMNRQIVSYDGFSWSYSPLKYWPAGGELKFRSWAPREATTAADPYLRVNGYDSSGLPTFSYECRTGLDPFYEANDTVSANNGVLSGDVAPGSNGQVKLVFHPAPNRYDIVATANSKLYDSPNPNPTGDYQECIYLIRSFKMWGVYKKAQYSMSEDKWYGQEGIYTKDDPLDMTQDLNLDEVEKSVSGYEYNPDAGYDTKKAVIVRETTPAQHTKLFTKPGFFIPANPDDDSTIDAGFEIQYVILTKKPDDDENKYTEYKETGIITRSGSLTEVFKGNKGRRQVVTDINLNFSEELTVTCTLYDYIYKSMF